MATRIRSRPGWDARRIAGWAWPVMVLALVGMLTGASAGEKTGPQAEAVSPPDVLTFPSSVGEVTFPHAMHVDDLGMDCTDCHHEVNAPALHTPHPQYLEDSRIQCGTCHHPAEKTGARAWKCSECHHRAGAVADEVLSAKVVTHETCEKCHEIGTGSEASNNCKKCHSGPRRPW